jgi:hypothetical protein
MLNHVSQRAAPQVGHAHSLEVVGLVHRVHRHNVFMLQLCQSIGLDGTAASDLDRDGPVRKR